MSNEELIAEARDLIDRTWGYNLALAIMGELADALEAAEAKLQAVRELHRKFTYYEHEDSCPDTSENHREERHHQSDEIGEFYCEDMPTDEVVCDLCRDTDGERMDWPCPTMEALLRGEDEENT